MSSGEKQVRLVIQSAPARGNRAPHYRVIVYPEGPGFQGPLTFSSREELLNRLLAAIPDFDVSLVRQADGPTRILFAGNVNLSADQLDRLYGV